MSQSIPSWCKRGAKVVCINADWPDDPISPLTKNAVYTVTEIGLFPDGVSGSPYGSESHIVVGLAEVTNPHDGDHPDLPVGFDIRRFRPLITKSQPEDVRMFKSLLREMPVSERLDRLAELLNE